MRMLVLGIQLLDLGARARESLALLADLDPEEAEDARPGPRTGIGIERERQTCAGTKRSVRSPSPS